MADRAVPAVNLPEVLDEVTECFLAYDQALLAGDVPALNRWFFDGPEATRFGLGQELYGSAEIAGWRRSAPALVRAPLRRYDVVTLASDVAVVTAEFDDTGAVGRQSQTWVRSDAGWRVLSGHVSLRAGA
ncbi:MAG: hypothetical protein QOF39_2944 [Frankiales bacterium]|nr:hypothetical protein [Frankiales bacterium]